MFGVNEIVVYRKDVFRIREIRKGKTKEDTMYLLVPYFEDDGSFQVQVPALNKMGYLRKLSTKADLDALIQRADQIDILDGNVRMIENEYRNRMKKPTLDDLMCIVKTTYLRNQERTDQNKKPSSVDSTYFREAEKALYQEVAAVMNISVEQAKDYVISNIEK